MWIRCGKINSLLKSVRCIYVCLFHHFLSNSVYFKYYRLLITIQLKKKKKTGYAIPSRVGSLPNTTSCTHVRVSVFCFYKSPGSTGNKSGVRTEAARPPNESAPTSSPCFHQSFQKCVSVRRAHGRPPLLDFPPSSSPASGQVRQGYAPSSGGPHCTIAQSDTYFTVW